MNSKKVLIIFTRFYDFRWGWAKCFILDRSNDKKEVARDWRQATCDIINER